MESVLELVSTTVPDITEDPREVHLAAGYRSILRASLRAVPSLPLRAYVTENGSYRVP